MTGKRSKAEGAELSFWRKWLNTEGQVSGTHDEFVRRFSSGPICEPEIEKRIGNRDRIRILDVGAGPCTFLGRNHPGVAVDIVATDRLARYYYELLDRYWLAPPITTRPIAGEDLLDEFPPASFDFCYSRNALDHVEDPTRCIANMINLLKPGGWLVLRHHGNEGAANGYAGMHQWNFWCENEHLTLTDQYQALTDVTSLFHELCPIRAFHDSTAWCVAVGQRTGETK